MIEYTEAACVQCQFKESDVPGLAVQLRENPFQPTTREYLCTDCHWDRREAVLASKDKENAA